MASIGSPQAPVVPIQTIADGTLREIEVTEFAEIVKQRIARNTAVARQGMPLIPRHDSPPALPAGFFSEHALREISSSADAETAFAPMRAVSEAKIAPLVAAHHEQAEQRSQLTEMLRLGEAGRREQLATRIRMRDAVRELAGKCDSAVARAETRIAQTDEALERFADLDSKITDALAATIRADHGTALPSHLAAAQRDRAKLMEAVTALHNAAAQLRSEAQAAHAKLDDAEKAVAAWTIAVIIARAEEAAEALAAINDQAASLRTELTSLGALAIAAGSFSLPIMLPHEVRAVVLATQPEPEIEPRLMDAFRDWAARLGSDAAAQFEEVNDVGNAE